MVKPVELEREGPMPISLADAAGATGISYGQLGDIAAKGAFEHVRALSEAEVVARLHRTEYLSRIGLWTFIVSGNVSRTC